MKEHFAIANTKPFATFSNKDNANLLQKLKSGLERKINWNKYQSEEATQTQSKY